MKSNKNKRETNLPFCWQWYASATKRKWLIEVKEWEQIAPLVSLCIVFANLLSLLRRTGTLVQYCSDCGRSKVWIDTMSLPTMWTLKAIEDFSLIFLHIPVINGNMLKSRATQLFWRRKGKGGGGGRGSTKPNQA